MLRAILAAVALLVAAPAASAPSDRHYIGMTEEKIIDGDTFITGSGTVRLYGIDAPESAQTCLRGGKPWKCGRKAARALEEKIGGKNIVCRVMHIAANGHRVSKCFLSSSGLPKPEDIAASMVREGWALAYRKESRAYVNDEAEARKAHRGIWAGTFTPPWEWRKQHRNHD